MGARGHMNISVLGTGNQNVRVTCSETGCSRWCVLEVSRVWLLCGVVLCQYMYYCLDCIMEDLGKL